MADSKRKLAAIVFTDIVGFTKLSSENEPAALALLAAQRKLLKPVVDEYNGEWLKEIGDGLLLSFSTNRDAVDCAIAIQKASDKEDGLNLRIGIHQGEVVFQGSDVVGDDVNIASRIEPFAAEGGIAISGRVNASLERDPDFETMFIGTPELKGVSQKTEVFCITSHNLPKTDISKVSAKLEAPKGFQWNVFSITGAILTIIGALFWINVSFVGIGTASESEVPSIAVLPFENKGAKEDDFYAYGISSDLISDVTSTGMIRVAGLNDIEKIDYANMSYKDLSDELLVRYVAKGTLWKMDTMFQLSMELFDTKNSEVVWSNRWQTAWRDLATIKDDLSNNILENLNIIITKNVEQINMVSNPEAYEFYLKGEYKFEKRVTLEDLMVARGFYQKAVELDSTLITAMIKLAKTYAFTNEYDTCIDLNNKALKRAIKQKDRTNEAYAINALGTAYWYRDGDNDKAQEYYEKGAEIANEIGDKMLQSYFLNNLSIIFTDKGETEKALKYMKEMLAIAEGLNDKKTLVFAYNNIGTVHQRNGELDIWFDYAKKTLAIANEIDNKNGQGYALSNIAAYHVMKEEYDIALQNFDQAMEIYKKLGDEQQQVSIYSNIGRLYGKKKDTKKAEEMYSRALDLSIKIDNKNLIIESYNHMFDYYRESEEYSMAFNSLFSARKIVKELNVPQMLANNFYWTAKNHSDRGDLDSAIVYLNRTMEIHQKLGNMSMVGPLYFELSVNYAIKGDIDNSLEMIIKSSALLNEVNDTKRIPWAQFFTGTIYFLKQEYKTAVDKYIEPAILSLKELDEDLGLDDTSIYFLCLKELKREYDIADLKKLIEKEKDDIGYIGNYYLFKLLAERSYLKNAFDQVMKDKSDLEPEVAEKYINYPIVKEIIKEWEMNI